jgi:hypothetical protein
VLLDGVGGVDGDLVVGASSRFLDAEIVIFQIDVEIGQDQLVLDEVPDDAGHLVAVEFDDRVCTLIFAILWNLLRGLSGGFSCAPLNKSRAKAQHAEG